ncbi:unnamed protein product [Didymodactylos carnosus]|uniref:Uncharacterized protein n=1 Tax=Didymodactylos carnosus TaxID=1234261 RepID=A0A814ZTA0_9BILA|nr:unnamed protein product [Didymodactylos carnosus]CAF1247969.1 unnamed protein product [Didymodactylos carnosus]CAF3845504.1 unnamed protein product [Didymodactylos carnosus]CAF4015229.1 unnamed protein product [Didymodactylos carnosus]
MQGSKLSICRILELVFPTEPFLPNPSKNIASKTTAKSDKSPPVIQSKQSADDTVSKTINTSSEILTSSNCAVQKPLLNEQKPNPTEYFHVERTKTKKPNQLHSFEKLVRLFGDSYTSHNTILQYIEKTTLNVPLMRIKVIILSYLDAWYSAASTTTQTSIAEHQMPLLRKVLSANIENEFQALYGIQLFCTTSVKLTGSRTAFTGCLDRLNTVNLLFQTFYDYGCIRQEMY